MEREEKLLEKMKAVENDLIIDKAPDSTQVSLSDEVLREVVDEMNEASL